MNALLKIILAFLFCVSSVSAQDMQKKGDDLLPYFSIEKLKYGTVVTIKSNRIQGLVMDIWCYEDALGDPVSHTYEGKTLVLTHKLGTANVTSHFKPLNDGVDILVRVYGPDEADIKKVRSLNPCCQFERSPAFMGEGDYVEDFVSRCFVYLENGMTYLKDTKRIPGTTGNETNADAEKPWIQEYYPTWRKHPGQVKGQRGYSTDRPVYPIIGTVSKDGKYLAAVVWPETMRLGQVWHHCVHPRPIISESFDASKGETVTHGKIYLMENNGKKLLKNFKKDFPEWKRPPDAD